MAAAEQFREDSLEPRIDVLVGVAEARPGFTVYLAYRRLPGSASASFKSCKLRIEIFLALSDCSLNSSIAARLIGPRRSMRRRIFSSFSSQLSIDAPSASSSSNGSSSKSVLRQLLRETLATHPELLQSHLGFMNLVACRFHLLIESAYATGRARAARSQRLRPACVRNRAPARLEYSLVQLLFQDFRFSSSGISLAASCSRISPSRD